MLTQYWLVAAELQVRPLLQQAFWRWSLTNQPRQQLCWGRSVCSRGSWSL